MTDNLKVKPGGFPIDNQIPSHWYNLAADFPEPMPPYLNPQTKEAITAQDLQPLFPPGLIELEMSKERYIEIPQRIRELYTNFRPAPLYRAHNLERELGTKCRIYYKYEGNSPAGSHKPNSAIAQAYYNAVAGIKRLTTETGAGRWGCNVKCGRCVLPMTTSLIGACKWKFMAQNATPRPRS